ncbi:MAG: TIGR03915 family putative DNA repair protein [Defluviitaleaceae bacterium]|nr:TIGR03915 family putative DNA repair protein [Defluviitaleaceae bacterium]
MVITFDGSFEGFLCVIYAVYYEKLSPQIIQIEGQEPLTIDVFSAPRRIETDDERASRVYKAVCEKISEQAAEYIFYAFLSEEENRFVTILSYVKLGFSVGHMVDSYLHEPFVAQVRKLARYVGREAHLLYGFCRFEKTLIDKNEIFYCKVTPKNDVLILLAQHFCQRLMNQAWIIHDANRNKAAVYDGNSYAVVNVPSDAKIIFAPDEPETQELWRSFVDALSIKERTNPKLQRQLLPLYFRKNMTEFDT